MTQDMGVPPTGRATHEPSPDGLGHSVSVPNADMAEQLPVVGNLVSSRILPPGCAGVSGKVASEAACTIEALYGAAVLAEKFIDAILSYCGTGLEVANWHLNGNLEPFDNFIIANQHGDRDELETLRAAIALAKGEA